MPSSMGILRAVAFLGGGLVVLLTLLSAVYSVVVPRAIPVLLQRYVFLAMLQVFRIRSKRARNHRDLDRLMAPYGPLSLLTMPLVWLTLVLAGYTVMFWALGIEPLRTAFVMSGSSLLTLGFAAPDDLPTEVLAFTEAALGVGLLALLITYLPSIYSAFSRREAAVAALEVRAGNPPSARAMMTRFYLIEGLDRLADTWRTWEYWFVELGETHTSLPALAFFRSPRPDYSWVTAAGAVLDGAAFHASTIEGDRVPEAHLCIRAGYIALRHIAGFFGISYDPDPAPDDPISVTREQYDSVYDELARIGLPLKADRDQAWRDFAGWRVNYDTVLLALAALTLAPPAPWFPERPLTIPRLPLTRRRSRHQAAV